MFDVLDKDGKSIVTFSPSWYNPGTVWNDTHYEVKKQWVQENYDDDQYTCFTDVHDEHNATADFYIVNTAKIEQSPLNFIVEKGDYMIHGASYTSGVLKIVIDVWNKRDGDISKSSFLLDSAIEYKTSLYHSLGKIKSSNSQKDGTKNVVVSFPVDSLKENVTYIITLDNGNVLGHFKADVGISITQTSLADGIVGKPYSQKIAMPDADKNGTQLSFHTQLTGNADQGGEAGLPPGLDISAEDPFVITGTPEKSGKYEISITAIRESDNASAVKFLVMNIQHDSMDIFIWDKQIKKKLTALDTFANSELAHEIGVEGGTPPYIFSSTSKGNTSPAFPVGIRRYDNFILGSTSKVGKYEFTITATDKFQNVKSKDFTLNVHKPVEILPSYIPPMSIGDLKKIKLSAKDEGEVFDSVFKLSNDSHESFSIISNELVINEQIKPGIYTITVLLYESTDGINAWGDFVFNRKTYVIVIGGKINITTTTLPRGKLGEEYKFDFQMNGQSIDTANINLVIPSLPSGLRQDLSTYGIRGIPDLQGEFNIEVMALDSVSKKDFFYKTYPLIIDGPPVVKNVEDMSLSYGRTSISLADYITSTVSITGGDCDVGKNTTIKATIDKQSILHLDVPGNITGHVSIRYSVNNKFGTSASAIISFYVGS